MRFFPNQQTNLRLLDEKNEDKAEETVDVNKKNKRNGCSCSNCVRFLNLFAGIFMITLFCVWSFITYMSNDTHQRKLLKGAVYVIDPDISDKGHTKLTFSVDEHTTPDDILGEFYHGEKSLRAGAVLMFQGEPLVPNIPLADQGVTNEVTMNIIHEHLPYPTLKMTLYSSSNVRFEDNNRQAEIGLKGTIVVEHKIRKKRKTSITLEVAECTDGADF